MAVEPTSGALRYAKWKARFARDGQGNLPQGSTTIMERLLTQPAFEARTQEIMTDLVTMEGLVRGVLNGEGVSVIQYPYYLAFGRELWKLSNRIAGESAAVEAQTQIQKWVARGLGQTVLEKIRTDVFSIPAPTP